jgi:GntR family transcriptional regulator
MLEVKLDGTDRTPLFEQVAGEIRRAIADGEAGPGDRLPPARDLAAVLGVNANTVLRALRILREFRQGRGVSVAGGARQRSTVSSKARELTQIAHRQGYGKDELIKLIAGIY